MASRHAVQGLKIIISLVLIGFLVNQIGWRSIAAQISRMNSLWLLGSLILFTLSHFIGGYQWYLLLRSQGIALSWSKTVSFYFVGLFFNNILISNFGGDIFRMVDVKRQSDDGPGSVSTVLVDRFMGLLILSGLAVLSAVWIWMEGSRAVYHVYLILILALVWLALIFIFFKRKWMKPFVWILKRIFPEGLVSKTREVYQNIVDFSRKPDLFWKVVGLSAVIQGMRIMTHWFIGRSLGSSVSPVYFFMFIPVIAIVSSLPISLGGLGIREQSGVYLFMTAGMLEDQAFSMEFMAYLISIVSSLPGIFIFMMRKSAPQKVESVHVVSRNADIREEYRP